MSFEIKARLYYFYFNTSTPCASKMELKNKIRANFARSTLIFQVFGLQYFSFSTKNDFLPTGKSALHRVIFILTFVVVAIEVFGVASVIKIQQSNRNSTRVSTGLMFQYGSYFFISFVVCSTAVHSHYSTSDAMKIFNNFERIFKVFEEKLKYTLNYDDTLVKFNRITIGKCIYFTVLTLITMCYVFYQDRSSIFYWALLSFMPYFIIILNFWKFCFYIKLVHLNLKGIKKVLINSHNLNRSGHLIELSLKLHQKSIKNFNLFHTISSVKEIYGIIYETVGMINKIMGVSSILQLVTILYANTSAGYKLYLISTGQMGVKWIGG